MPINQLEGKIVSKTARIGIVGLGYVGLPLAIEFAKAGFYVLGIDIDESKVESIKSGINYIKDIDNDYLKDVVNDGHFTATLDYSKISNLDIIIICVPTPLNKLKDPDVSYIISVLDEIVKCLHENMLIVLESTTYPGTTRELILPSLEETGLKVGENINLVFSPERIDPGNDRYTLKNTPKVVGGITPNCTELGRILYNTIITDVVTVKSTESAEMVKLLENTFRSINIGLVNEMAIMCDKLGVNVWEVIDAAATKPFGFMKFLPGPGLGGHCIPIDPHYLAWKMKSLDYKARFIELAGEINTEMPFYVTNLVSEGLNRFKKSINGAKVLIIGIAYKPDIDDVRESPALDVMKILEEKGAEVIFHDPYIGEIQWNGERMHSQDISPELLSSQDIVVVITNHSIIDFSMIRQYSKLVVDTRNIIDGDNSNVIKLGAV